MLQSVFVYFEHVASLAMKRTRCWRTMGKGREAYSMGPGMAEKLTTKRTRHWKNHEEKKEKSRGGGKRGWVLSMSQDVEQEAAAVDRT